MAQHKRPGTTAKNARRRRALERWETHLAGRKATLDKVEAGYRDGKIRQSSLEYYRRIEREARDAISVLRRALGEGVEA